MIKREILLFISIDELVFQHAALKNLCMSTHTTLSSCLLQTSHGKHNDVHNNTDGSFISRYSLVINVALAPCWPTALLWHDEIMRRVYWEAVLFSCHSYGTVYMMASTNGNIFRVTGPLCGEFAGHRWIPPPRKVTRMFSLTCAWTWTFVDKQSRRRWYGTWSRWLWRHCNVHRACGVLQSGDSSLMRSKNYPLS